MHVLEQFKTIGECSGCNEFCALSGAGSGSCGVVTAHNNAENKPCTGVGLDPVIWDYMIKNDHQAHAMVQIILKSDGSCFMGGDKHSEICRHGTDCLLEHIRRAKALATFAKESEVFATDDAVAAA